MILLRLVHLMRRKPDIPREAFGARLRDELGPLVAFHQTDLDLIRYVQVHPDPADQGLDHLARADRGMVDEGIDSAIEYWWRSAESFLSALRSLSGRAAAEALTRAEVNLCEFDTSSIWLGLEYPQIATNPLRPVAKARTGIMRLLFAFRALPDVGEEKARQHWLHVHGPLIRSHSAARGLIAYNQVHRHETNLIDVWPAAHRGKAASFIGYAESWFDRQITLRGPEFEAAKLAALADERRFIDWSSAAILIGKEHVFVDRDWT